MGSIEGAKRKLQDAAGGARGARGEETDDGKGDQQPEGDFEPEEVRRRKKPKDDLPQPKEFRPTS